MPTIDEKLDAALRAAEARGNRRSAVDEKLDAAISAKGGQGDSSPQWSDLPGNIIPSAVQLGKDMFAPFMEPNQTIANLGALGYGAAQRGADALFRSPEEAQERRSQGGFTGYADMVAGGAGQLLDDRYGTLLALKRTARTDPVGELVRLHRLDRGPDLERAQARVEEGLVAQQP